MHQMDSGWFKNEEHFKERIFDRICNAKEAMKERKTQPNIHFQINSKCLHFIFSNQLITLSASL